MKDEKHDMPADANKDWSNVMMGTTMYGVIGIVAGYLGWMITMVVFGGLAVLRISPLLWDTITSMKKDQDKG